MINSFCLTDKNILVTGASSGIGQQVAISCSQMSANVIITGRNNVRLEETLRLLTGDNNAFISADLTSEEEIDNLIDKLPILNGLVLNAGMNKKEPTNHISTDAITSIMNTNFTSNVILVRKLLKAKKIAKGASIVFTSSISVYRPAVGNAIYAASKGAINSYMKVLALELSQKRIRVNTIMPGMVWTHLMDNSPISKEEYEKDERRYPLGRYGKPEDIANAAIFLLSDASSWTTGSSIVIDGGISLI
ncbi:MAG: SDR family oxidoreductase [Rikenellaceae bacterium]